MPHKQYLGKYTVHTAGGSISPLSVVKPCEKAQNWGAHLMCLRNKEGLGTTSHSGEAKDGESGGGEENQNHSCDMANPHINRHGGRE